MYIFFLTTLTPLPLLSSHVVCMTSTTTWCGVGYKRFYRDTRLIVLSSRVTARWHQMVLPFISIVKHDTHCGGMSITGYTSVMGCGTPANKQSSLRRPPSDCL